MSDMEEDGDDDEAGGYAAGVDLDGVGGEASSLQPAQDLAPELVVAHARDDRGVAAELVEVARDVRRGAPEEEARGKGVPEGLADDGDALAGRRLDPKRRRPPRLGSASSKSLGRRRAIGSPDRDEGPRETTGRPRRARRQTARRSPILLQTLWQNWGCHFPCTVGAPCRISVAARAMLVVAEP